MNKQQIAKQKKDFNEKLKDYSKFLVHDRDYDWAHILNLLAFKLKRTREHIINHNVMLNSRKMGSEIKQVEVLLKRVVDDKYFEPFAKELNKKYGPTKMVTKPVENGKLKDLLTLKIYRTKETDKNSKQINKETMAMYAKADKMKRDDLKKAFDIMHKKMFNWWD